MAAADAFMLLLSCAAAVAIGPVKSQDAVGWAAAYGLSVLVILRARGFYAFRLGGSSVPEVGRIVAATAVAAMAIICARVIAGAETAAAGLAARLWVYSTAFLAAGRFGIAQEARRLWKHGASHPTIILGTGQVGRLLARRLRERPELGLNPIGYVDDEPTSCRAGDDLPYLGGTCGLDRIVAEHRVQHVIVTFSRTKDEQLLSAVRRCKELGTEVAIVPRLYEQTTHHLTIEHVGAIPLIRVGQPDPSGWQFLAKYTLDRVLAAILVLLLAPLLAAIAVGIRLSSPGPIMFRQRRIGREGREFTMFKFRTMRGDPAAGDEADAAWAAEILGVRGSVADGSDDNRTTRFGDALRRRSLDELPQLFNVLRGEMSLVGPRPERVSYARDFERVIYRYADRHRVKSGITGWAQVQRLRGQTSLADRVEWDNYYIENWTLWLDLKILAMTPAALRAPRDAR